MRDRVRAEGADDDAVQSLSISCGDGGLPGVARRSFAVRGGELDVNPATAEQVKAPRADAIEVLLTLSPRQYAEMGHDLEEVKRQLDLPSSASNTQVILEAVRRQASPG
jgi:hypothetical protein